MLTEKISVSIIIPCRNEKYHIARCLDSVIANDYPKDKLEVLVIDGKSEDGTEKIVERYAESYPFIKLLENSKKIIPSALNIGIKKATGNIILRIDAHSECSNNYISKCVENLNRYKVDNVGGVWKILPRDKTLVGRAIAFILSSPLGAGNSFYKLGCSEPKFVDTVPFGCYRKEVFDKIGLYDENAVRSEDMDLNLRLTKSGGKILLVPDIISYYYARSNIIEFTKHNFENGFWVTYPVKFGRIMFSWRHLVPLIFVVSVMITGFMALSSIAFLKILSLILVAYFFIAIYFSLGLVKQEKDLRYLLVTPLSFIILHLSYGLGSMWGLLKLLFSSISNKNNLSCI